MALNKGVLTWNILSFYFFLSHVHNKNKITVPRLTWNELQLRSFQFTVSINPLTPFMIWNRLSYMKNVLLLLHEHTFTLWQSLDSYHQRPSSMLPFLVQAILIHISTIDINYSFCIKVYDTFLSHAFLFPKITKKLKFWNKSLTEMQLCLGKNSQLKYYVRSSD